MLQAWKKSLAVLSIFIAIFLIIAIFSHSPEDPSLLHAVEHDSKNIMGWYGSYVADPLMQSFGYSSLSLAVFALIVSLRILKEKPTPNIIIRLSLVIMILPILATFIGFIDAREISDSDNATMRYGGFVGYYIASELAVNVNGRLVSLSLLTIMFLGYVYATYLPLEWMGRYIKEALYEIKFKIRMVFRRGSDGARQGRQYNVGGLFSGEVAGADGLGYRGGGTKSGLTSENSSIFSTTGSARRIDSRSEDNKSQQGNCAFADEGGANAFYDGNISIENNGITTNTQPFVPQNIGLDDKQIITKQSYKTTNQASSGQPSSYIQQYSTSFILPPVNLLKVYNIKHDIPALSYIDLQESAELLMQVLQDFGIRGEITKFSPGPVVTLYELEPAAGTKSSRVIGLADDIARSMCAVSARISVVPGKNAIGVELPNPRREMVFLRELMEGQEYTTTEAKLPLVLGKNIGGGMVIADLAKMPHLLVAGTTGSGKSVAINTMILSLLYKHTPQQCRLMMIDPKMLELSVYDGIPHLLTPVVTEPSKAVNALKWVVREMESRYRAMSILGVRNIHGYNSVVQESLASGRGLEKHIQTGFDAETGQPMFESVAIKGETFPFIVVIVDEMADLMLVAGKDIEAYIQRLAQMARAAGIHLIMATQRPSVDVITGVIKANFPTRISFQVTSKIDSRTILSESGAEQLLGMGDMLYMMSGGKIERVHGPFVDDKEVEAVVSFLKAQGQPQYITDIAEDGGDSGDGNYSGESGDVDVDDLYEQALAIIIRDKRATTSYLQRCLKIGYNKAASLIERMEKDGIVSPPNHVGKREILK